MSLVSRTCAKKHSSHKNSHRRFQRRVDQQIPDYRFGRELLLSLIKPNWTDLLSNVGRNPGIALPLETCRRESDRLKSFFTQIPSPCVQRSERRPLCASIARRLCKLLRREVVLGQGRIAGPIYVLGRRCTYDAHSNNRTITIQFEPRKRTKT